MTITAVIAEYNPFHLGHAYHLQEAKRLTGADALVVVMSGNFTQRGTPAILDKYARARMALACGADLVLELPLRFACASAEAFAGGAVSILENLGCVDYLCFGSECGRLESLERAAASLLELEKNPLCRKRLQEGLRRGLSFPSARNAALEGIADPSCLQALQSPNNILGAEYLKALKKLESPIRPVTIPRLGSGYHDQAPNGEAPSSATAIRALLRGGKGLEAVRPHVPKPAWPLWEEEWEKGGLLTEQDFSGLLHYRLLMLEQGTPLRLRESLRFRGSLLPQRMEGQAENPFAAFADVSHDLADKIRKSVSSFQDWNQFCTLLHSRDLTWTRVSRCMAHILLDLKQEDLETSRQNGFASYTRILGFSRRAAGSAGPQKALKAHIQRREGDFAAQDEVPERSLLSQIKCCAASPPLSKLADAGKLLPPQALPLLEEEIRASHIYQSVSSQKYGKPFLNEYQRPIVLF